MLALDSMARLWFKRTDKHINKTVSCYGNEERDVKEGGYKTSHESESERRCRDGNLGRTLEGFL